MRMTRGAERGRQNVYRLLGDHLPHDTGEVDAAGGLEGTRRLRELREMGHPIEEWPKPGGGGWYLYRLCKHDEERPVQTELVLR